VVVVIKVELDSDSIIRSFSWSIFLVKFDWSLFRSFFKAFRNVNPPISRICFNASSCFKIKKKDLLFIIILKMWLKITFDKERSKSRTFSCCLKSVKLNNSKSFMNNCLHLASSASSSILQNSFDIKFSNALSLISSNSCPFFLKIIVKIKICLKRNYWSWNYLICLLLNLLHFVDWMSMSHLKINRSHSICYLFQSYYCKTFSILASIVQLMMYFLQIFIESNF
jgi:hypothetical protein